MTASQFTAILAAAKAYLAAHPEVLVALAQVLADAIKADPKILDELFALVNG